MKTISLVFLCAAAVACAQDNPLSAETKALYGMTKANILKSAQKMPEKNFGFKPAESVRSFAGVVGHIADAQYLFCGAVKGESKQMNIEKTQTTQEGLVAALKDAFAYCDAVYDSMADSAAADKIKFFGSQRTKLETLNFNIAHNFEHYGNLVTYMRIKGVVPPSSEGQ
jgi:uncharacterized damage-inducible protein DinB